MIKEIRLRNFQAHRSLRLKLSPKVTTIVGTSDVGKSAIIRALFWVCFNRPSGDQFKTHDESTVMVAVKVDGQIIKRSKSAGANWYSLDTKIMKAFGTGVPDSISDLLNVQRENFQLQHDAPFWFSLSPGEVSKRLNAIVDLQVIDRSQKNINQEAKRIKARREVVADRVKTREADCESLSWCQQAHQESTRIMDLAREAQRASLRAVRIRDCIVPIEDLKPQTDRLRAVLGRFGPLDTLSDEVSERLNLCDRLREILRACLDLDQLCRRQSKDLTRVEQRLSELKSERCPLCGK